MSRARAILSLAWPVLVGQWAALSYMLLDTIMTGHASPTDLAAVGLGNSIYISSYIGLMGVLMSLNPVIAHYFGAQHQEDIGRVWCQGNWLALMLAVLGIAAISMPDVWLVMSKVEPPVRAAVGDYLVAIAFALPAALLFRVMYAFNTAVSRPKLIMAINLGGMVLKLPLNYVLIYGKLGLPALGSTGCGIATAIVMWTSCAAGWWIMRRDPFYQRFAIRFDWPRWSQQKELLRLGVPIGLTNAVEVTSFTFMALLAARLGTAVSAGHQISSNLAALCFMPPLALAVATSTLVAQALGAHNPVEARRYALTGLRLGLAEGLALALTVWLGRETLIGWYTSDPGVATVAMTLLPLVALFHIFDSLQVLAGFSLRSYKRTLAPLLIYSIGLWGLGLVGGYWIAFQPIFNDTGLGARGLWLAASGALGIAALTLIAYLGIVSRREVFTVHNERPDPLLLS